MNKEHILNEIKRTAKANGGKPLGMQAFYHETGIKSSDWQGKYWARWGDALQECGLEANTLQAARDEGELILHFVESIRELGKFPTKPEIQMKARRSPGFRWPNTFARLGSKKEIGGACGGIFQTEHTVHPAISREPSQEIGFVYLMKSGRNYKIGRTKHVGGRERDLSIQLPDKVGTVHSIRTDDPSGIESYWHNRFASQRKNGEWFELGAEDVAAFKRRKFM
jgi:Meiotically Up-regulated Gene 113 (MUG113) protein